MEKNNVSYEEAKDRTSEQEILQLQATKEKTSSSVGKIIGSALFALLLSLPATNYYAIYAVIAFIILCILSIRYIALKPIFKVLNYNMILFLVWQTAAIFFLIVFLRVKADSYHLIPLFYILLAYGLSFLLIRSRIRAYLRESFQNTSKNKKSVFSKTITRLLGAFLAIVVLALLFYRGNKWWLMNMNTSVDDPSFLVYAIWGVGLLVLLFGFTLLPTLIFLPSQYVKARLTKKYSEEYRNEYGFTEKEWYGE